MSFHFFSWITERGERSGVSLFLSLGLGGLVFLPFGSLLPFLPGLGSSHGPCISFDVVPFYSSTVTFLIKLRVSLEVRHALVVNLLVLRSDISGLLRWPMLYRKRKDLVR